MLRVSMFFLICALCCGVFGFSPAAAPSWFITRGLFFVCFGVAMTALAYGTTARRSSWQTIDHQQGAYF